MGDNLRILHAPACARDQMNFSTHSAKRDLTSSDSAYESFPSYDDMRDPSGNQKCDSRRTERKRVTVQTTQTWKGQRVLSSSKSQELKGRLAVQKEKNRESKIVTSLDNHRHNQKQVSNLNYSLDPQRALLQILLTNEDHNSSHSKAGTTPDPPGGHTSNLDKPKKSSIFESKGKHPEDRDDKKRGVAPATPSTKRRGDPSPVFPQVLRKLPPDSPGRSSPLSCKSPTPSLSLTIAPPLTSWDAGRETQVKFIMLGDYGVGKSQLIQALSKASTPGHTEFRCSDFRPGELVELSVTCGGHRMRVKIVDTAGQERFRSLTSSYFRGIQGCLLVFNLTRPDSFSNISTWFADMQWYSGGAVSNTILLGVTTPSQNPEAREISTQRALRLADGLQVPYLETTMDDHNMLRCTVQRLLQKVVVQLSLAAGPRHMVKISPVVVNGKKCADVRLRVACCTVL